MGTASKWLLGAGIVAAAFVAVLVVLGRDSHRVERASIGWTQPFYLNFTCTTGRVIVKALPQGGALRIDDNGVVDWLGTDGAVLAQWVDSNQNWVDADADAAGNVAIFTSAGHVDCYAPDARLKWSTKICDGPRMARLKFGDDGSLSCLVEGGRLVMLDPNGAVARTLALPISLPDPLEFVTPADGRVCLVSEDEELLAFDAEGRQIWDAIPGDFYDCGLELLSDGALILTPIEGAMQVLNPDGSLRWQYPNSASGGSGMVREFAYSTVSRAGDIVLLRGRNLLCFAPDGRLIWSTTLPGQVLPLMTPSNPIESPNGTWFIQVDCNNPLRGITSTILTLGQGQIPENFAILAVSPDGRLLWQGNIDGRFVLGLGCDNQGALYGIGIGDTLTSTGFTSTQKANIVRIDPPLIALGNTT